jgi:hypothetical protein
MIWTIKYKEVNRMDPSLQQGFPAAGYLQLKIVDFTLSDY